MKNASSIVLFILFALLSAGCQRHFGHVLHAHGSYTHESFEDAMFSLEVPMQVAVTALEQGFLPTGGRVLVSKALTVYPVVGEPERRCYAALQEGLSLQRRAEQLDRVDRQPDYAGIAERHGVVIPCEPMAFSSVGLAEARYVELSVTPRTARRTVAGERGRSADGLVYGRLVAGEHRETLTSRLRVYLFRLVGERTLRGLAYAVPVAGSVEASYRGDRTADALWREYLDGTAELLLVRSVRHVLVSARVPSRTARR